MDGFRPLFQVRLLLKFQHLGPCELQLRLSPVRLDWLCTIPRVRHSLILWLRAGMLRGGDGPSVKMLEEGELGIYTAKIVFCAMKIEKMT